MIGHHPRELLALERVAPDHRVVDVHLVGHGDEAAAADRHLGRLVVVVPIAVVTDAGLGDEVGGVVGEGGGRREPAGELLAGEPPVSLHAVGDDRALLLLGQPPVVLRVVDAVTQHVPVALDHRRHDLRVVLPVRHVERDGAGDAEPVGHLHHPPQTDPVAVIAGAVAEHIGVRAARPRVAGSDRARPVFVMLDVRHHPDRHPRVVRPAQPRSGHDRRVGHALSDHAKTPVCGSGRRNRRDGAGPRAATDPSDNKAMREYRR